MRVSPVVGAGVGGGLSALTQVALKLAVKLENKPASDQKVKLFLYRHAGLVALGVSAIAAAVVRYGFKQKEGALALLVAGAATSAPGIVAGVQAVLRQKEYEKANPTTPYDVSKFGVAVAQPRGQFGAAPTVELYGPAGGQVELFGAQSGSSGYASFNPAAFGGQSF